MNPEQSRRVDAALDQLRGQIRTSRCYWTPGAAPRGWRIWRTRSRHPRSSRPTRNSTKLGKIRYDTCCGRSRFTNSSKRAGTASGRRLRSAAVNSFKRDENRQKDAGSCATAGSLRRGGPSLGTIMAVAGSNRAQSTQQCAHSARDGHRGQRHAASEWHHIDCTAGGLEDFARYEPLRDNVPLSPGATMFGGQDEGACRVLDTDDFRRHPFDVDGMAPRTAATTNSPCGVGWKSAAPVLDTHGHPR